MATIHKELEPDRVISPTRDQNFSAVMYVVVYHSAPIVMIREQHWHNHGLLVPS